MKFIINDSYFIEGSNMSWTLNKIVPAKKNKKTGKEMPEKISMEGYYSSLKNARKSAADILIREAADFTEIDSILTRIEAIN